MFVQSYHLCNAGNAKYTKQNLTRGGKIFLAFLLIEYMLPLFINLIHDSQPIFRLPIESEAVLLSIFLIILTSISAIIVAKYTPTITPKNTGPIKPLPRWLIIVFSFIAIYVGYSAFNTGLTQWRYTTSISSSPTVLYASLIQTLMPVLGFWVLMTDQQLILSRSKSDILTKIFLLFGLVFSTNGFGSMFVTLIFAIVFIAPNVMLGFLFVSSSKKDNNKNFFKYIGIAIILPLIIIPLFFLSTYAKSGVSEDFSLQERASAYTNINYLINRHSVHLSQLAASIEDGSNYSDLILPIDNALFRFSLITGLNPEAQKPEISSFSRLALLQFADFKNINPKGGSSPGLLASMTMVFPLPLALLSIFLVTFCLIKLTDFVLCRQPPFSFMGALIFAYIPFRMVTDSPFDLLTPGPVSIILLLTLLLSFRRENLNAN